jgi:hypothetical protein
MSYQGQGYSFVFDAWVGAMRIVACAELSLARNVQVAQVDEEEFEVSVG